MGGTGRESRPVPVQGEVHPDFNELFQEAVKLNAVGMDPEKGPTSDQIAYAAGGAKVPRSLIEDWCGNGAPESFEVLARVLDSFGHVDGNAERLLYRTAGFDMPQTQAYVNPDDDGAPDSALDRSADFVVKQFAVGGARRLRRALNARAALEGWPDD